jgi:protein-L-isoaspartate(D-aspartate) O-methyltransferase
MTDARTRKSAMQATVPSTAAERRSLCMPNDHDRGAERESMLDTIRAGASETQAYTGVPAFSERVLEALGRVPRHRFVPRYLQREAYADCPLPIGHGQTISQPYIVALMTHLLAVGAAARVLEVGTGCGYQSAVLAELVRQVYSIEVVEPLAASAAQRLRALGYRNVEVRHSDGYLGWSEQAPFDGIIVTAGAPHVPQPLVDQLASGANLVIPVSQDHGQRLLVVRKQADGRLERREVLPVAFVPLVRGEQAARGGESG